ncbi:P-loop containing nucleoside triphosphate hydrolase protein, partial [Cercophora newfieldiana]
MHSDKLKAIFPFELFNGVQSKCFDVIYNTGDNVVVSAPTGSGKTALLELAICRLALNRGNENFKIVYQAPTKALCSEKARDWESKFSHMSLKCAELTGDTSQKEMKRVGEASIIVTTPEKWDSITRKWHDHRRLLQMVELFLIDEVHILKDMRGATLEAVVSRMKTIGANVRFIALSATVPNSEDIAQWLGRNHTNQQLPAHRETFREEFRPVKLEKFVYGYQCTGNEFVFDKFLDTKLPGLLSRHSHKKPILIFCFTRKSCETTASMLASYVSGRPRADELWPMPTKNVVVINRELREMAKFGVAFHHAGLDVQDRNVVEQSFLKGQLSVICCTSTLAVGVNLPCHTAVLKGTIQYTDESFKEFSDLEVMQMLGRAGRPQFDDSATAIILTRSHNKERYEQMVSGQQILESTLHLNLIEHLNSEICLGTVSDLQSAKTWLGGTFLSVRLRRNPKHYNITGGMSNPAQIDAELEKICERDVKLLQEAKLVTDGQNFKCTDYGRSMSRYMVEFGAMKNLLQIPRAVGIEALLTALCQSSEFREFRFKPAERQIFREVNQSQLLMYPIKEVVNQTWHKISLIAQAELGSIQYTETGEGSRLRRQLVMERKMIFERLLRLVRAVVDCKGYDRDATGVKNALELARALSAESWEGRATQLTQVPNIGPAGMRKLASKGVRTVLDLADKEHDEIERLMSRQPPFGRKLKEDLDRFPRLALDVAVSSHKLQLRQKEEPVVINVSATIRYLNRKTTPNWLNKWPLLTLFAELGDGTLAYFWRGNMKKVDKHNGLAVKFSVGLRSASDYITCHLSCEEIVGTAVTKVLEHGLSESVFPPGKRSSAAATPIPPRQGVVERSEYMDDDGLEERDLIEAAEQAMSSLAKGPEPQKPREEEYLAVDDLVAVSVSPQQETERHDMDSHDFDDRLAAQPRGEATRGENEQEAWSEPVQLPSGKWQCNHACSGGARTKSGKVCTHRCCKEGLDKPRKRPPTKPKKRKEG